MLERLVPFIALMLTGCSLVVDGKIENVVISCLGRSDGTPCLSADYCVMEQCRFATCGDGIVNPTRGEQCDDGNGTPGDGCQPDTCVFTCTSDATCPSDGMVCNGNEVCNLSSHTCSEGPVASTGTPCTINGSSGGCAGGFCVAAGCGNGMLDPGETCEPGAASPGCRPDCTWECEQDFQCPPADRCGSTRSCDVTMHQCIDGPPVNCDDGDTCTADSCNPNSGCQNLYVDADGDGYSATDPAGAVCGAGHLPGDCDDYNFQAHPGSPEQCNGIDDDCNNVIDDNVVSVTCAIDGDGDGYGDPSNVMTACACPMGYVPLGAPDCNDRNRLVSPGYAAGSFEPSPYCNDGTIAQLDANDVFGCRDNSIPSFDYDCDKGEVQQATETSDTACAFNCDGGGWANGFVPGCGVLGTWVDCYGAICLIGSGFPRRQACR